MRLGRVGRRREADLGPVRRCVRSVDLASASGSRRFPLALWRINVDASLARRRPCRGQQLGRRAAPLPARRRRPLGLPRHALRSRQPLACSFGAVLTFCSLGIVVVPGSSQAESERAFQHVDRGRPRSDPSTFSSRPSTCHGSHFGRATKRSSSSSGDHGNLRSRRSGLTRWVRPTESPTDRHDPTSPAIQTTATAL